MVILKKTGDKLEIAAEMYAHHREEVKKHIFKNCDFDECERQLRKHGYNIIDHGISIVGMDGKSREVTIFGEFLDNNFYNYYKLNEKFYPRKKYFFNIFSKPLRKVKI